MDSILYFTLFTIVNFENLRVFDLICRYLYSQFNFQLILKFDILIQISFELNLI